MQHGKLRAYRCPGLVNQKFPARPRVHPPHRHSRTHAIGHWETSCEIPKKTEHTDPVQGSPLRDLPEWLREFIDNFGVALGFGLGNAKIQEALDVLENFHRRDTHRGVPEVTLVVRSFFFPRLEGDHVA